MNPRSLEATFRCYKISSCLRNTGYGYRSKASSIALVPMVASDPAWSLVGPRFGEQSSGAGRLHAVLVPEQTKAFVGHGRDDLVADPVGPTVDGLRDFGAVSFTCIAPNSIAACQGIARAGGRFGSEEMVSRQGSRPCRSVKAKTQDADRVVKNQCGFSILVSGYSRGKHLANALGGFGGNDEIDGGSGADMIGGGKGSDNIKGGDGDDYISSSADVLKSQQQRGKDDAWQNYGLPQGKEAISTQALWGIYKDTRADRDGVTIWAGITETDTSRTEGDVIDAGAGDDWVIASWGDDRVKGGEGKAPATTNSIALHADDTLAK